MTKVNNNNVKWGGCHHVVKALFAKCNYVVVGAEMSFKTGELAMARGRALPRRPSLAWLEVSSKVWWLRLRMCAMFAHEKDRLRLALTAVKQNE